MAAPITPFVITAKPAMMPLTITHAFDFCSMLMNAVRAEAVMAKVSIASGAPQLPNNAVIGLSRKIVAANQPVIAAPTCFPNQTSDAAVTKMARSEGNRADASLMPKRA